MTTRHFVAATCAFAVAALVSVSAQSPAPKSEKELIARVQQAFDHQSIVEIRQLVYWGKSNPDAKTSFDRLASSDFSQKPGKISIAPLGANEKLQYTLNGITYVPTLKATGRMTIDFVVPPGAKMKASSTSYLIGTRNGGYYLLTAEPSTP